MRKQKELKMESVLFLPQYEADNRSLSRVFTACRDLCKTVAAVDHPLYLAANTYLPLFWGCTLPGIPHPLLFFTTLRNRVLRPIHRAD
jgi:hypothetical protein